MTQTYDAETLAALNALEQQLLAQAQARQAAQVPPSMYREAGIPNPYYNMPGSREAQEQYGIPPVIVQDQPYATAAYMTHPNGSVSPLIGYPSVYPHVLNGVPQDYAAPYIMGGGNFAAGGNYGYDPNAGVQQAQALIAQMLQGMTPPKQAAVPAQTQQPTAPVQPAVGAGAKSSATLPPVDPATPPPPSSGSNTPPLNPAVAPVATNNSLAAAAAAAELDPNMAAYYLGRPQDAPGFVGPPEPSLWQRAQAWWNDLTAPTPVVPTSAPAVPQASEQPIQQPAAAAPALPVQAVPNLPAAQLDVVNPLPQQPVLPAAQPTPETLAAASGAAQSVPVSIYNPAGVTPEVAEANRAALSNWDKQDWENYLQTGVYRSVYYKTPEQQALAQGLIIPPGLNPRYENVDLPSNNATTAPVVPAAPVSTPTAVKETTPASTSQLVTGLQAAAQTLNDPNASWGEQVLARMQLLQGAQLLGIQEGAQRIGEGVSQFGSDLARALRQGPNPNSLAPMMMPKPVMTPMGPVIIP